MKPFKSKEDSKTESTHIIIPNDVNAGGHLHGGVLMQWMDLIAAITATRHANTAVTTAAVDSLIFCEPVRIGDIINLKSSVTWVGNSSMEIMVKVYKDVAGTRESLCTNHGFFVFVALDQQDKPTRVPRLALITALDEELFAAAKQRMEQRKQGK